MKHAPITADPGLAPSTVDPRDVAAATELVDHTLKGASPVYVALHRARMIHNEIGFQRFARISRESREARASHRQPVQGISA